MAGKTSFTYEITKKLCVLKEAGYRTKELNMVSYNGAEPKYDLRLWMHFDEGTKMGKGITLDADELRTLRDALNGLEDL